MCKWLWFSVLAFLLMAGVGCKTPSMNKSVGLTDGAVSVAVAVALDQVSAAKYADSKAEVIKVCTDLQTFLKTGDVADLPAAKVEEAMLKILADKGWGNYSSIVRSLFDYLEAVSLETGNPGKNNLILLNIGLTEAIDAATRSKFEWRPQADKSQASP